MSFFILSYLLMVIAKCIFFWNHVPETKSLYYFNELYKVL